MMSCIYQKHGFIYKWFVKEMGGKKRKEPGIVVHVYYPRIIPESYD